MGNVASNAAQDPEIIVLEESRLSNEQLRTKLSQGRFSGQVALRLAIERQDAASLRAVLAKHKWASVRDGQGFTLLHWAALLKWFEGVKELVEAGVDVNATSAEGYTALHCAAFCGDSPSAELLMTHGATLEARSRRGSTPLLLAAQCGRPARAVLEQLVQRRADLNVAGYRDRTPVQLAVVAHGDAGIVQLLADAGADVRAANAALQRLTPLHTAAHLGRVDAMRVLLASGADPDARTDDGVTPLVKAFTQPSRDAASESRKREVFKLLREAGADVNAAIPSRGWTVLHCAFGSCREEATAAALLDGGASPDVFPDSLVGILESGSRNTMLHVAAKRGWAGVAARLCDAGASTSARNKEGLTPMHVAVVHKRTAAVRALLVGAADPLALGPDLYPSYSHWKSRRGLRALQGLVDLDGPAALEGLLASMSAVEEDATAVDCATAVTQDIPTVEAFLAAGLAPSPRALELAVECTPVMRRVVKRPRWSPESHAEYPPAFQAAIRQLLLCLRRAGLALLPEVLASIATAAAYPISAWASPDWLNQQQLRLPQPLPAQQPAGGGGGNAGAGGPAQQAPQPQILGAGFFPMGLHNVQPMGLHPLQQQQQQQGPHHADLAEQMAQGLAAMAALGGGGGGGPPMAGGGGGAAGNAGGGGGPAHQVMQQIQAMMENIGGGQMMMMPGGALNDMEGGIGQMLNAAMGAMAGGAAAGAGAAAGVLGGAVPVGAIPLGAMPLGGAAGPGGGGEVHVMQFEFHIPLPMMGGGGGPGGVPPGAAAAAGDAAAAALGQLDALGQLFQGEGGGIFADAALGAADPFGHGANSEDEEEEGEEELDSDGEAGPVEEEGDGAGPSTAEASLPAAEAAPEEAGGGRRYNLRGNPKQARQY